jgi:integrase/recombinase XerD
LLRGFGAKRTGKLPSALEFADLSVSLACAFLDLLERHPKNGVRTRNAQLAAIHSLFLYAALHHPEHAATIASGVHDAAQAL